MPHVSRRKIPHLVTPRFKWGVQPGSFTHMTEFFGPMLGVMKAKNLQEAIELTNQTGYGLTSGLESLDDREQARLDRFDSSRQPVRQPRHDRRDCAAATVRRHGQIGLWPRHQGRWPELCGSADAVSRIPNCRSSDAAGQRRAAGDCGTIWQGSGQARQPDLPAEDLHQVPQPRSTATRRR